jgi:glycosyltransferase involved in cell wall biosynthesis
MQQTEMFSPRISIVIPCYNQGNTLEETVESVLNQTFPDFEIVIVNDGSTDPETQQLLETVAKPRTRVIHTTNQGLAAARNNGIREATGRYILPLDADDRIGPTYLEKAVRILDENDGIGIVTCKAEFFGAVQKPWNLPEFSLEEMLLDNILFCSCVFRKKAWESVGGYRTDMKYGWEDYDFWLSLIESGALVYRIPEVLFFYRISPDSMLRTTNRDQKIEMFENIFHHHLDFYRKNIRMWISRLIDIPVDRTRQWVAQVYVDTGMGFHEKQMALHYLEGNETFLEFDLSRFANIRSIRLDPVNDSAVLCIHDIALMDTFDIRHEIRIRSHNGIEHGNGNFFFTSTDPHILLDVPDMDIQSLVVTLDYIAIGPNTYQHLMDMQSRIIGEGNRKVTELNQFIQENKRQISEQESRIEEQRQAIHDKDVHIQNLEQSLQRIRRTLVWRLLALSRNVFLHAVTLARRIQKAVAVYRRGGVHSVMHHFLLHLEHAKSGGVVVPEPVGIGLRQEDYDIWKQRRQITDEVAGSMRAQIADWAIHPMISILVPVYNVDRVWLEKAIQSVLDQVYDKWELCLADDASTKPHVREVLEAYAARDPRIKAIFPEENQGIAGASNSAASLATGEYLGFLDHDDELSPDALFEMARLINDHPDAGLIYSDEDKMDMEGNRIEPFFKPDYSPDLLLSQNYFCHFTVIQKTLFEEVGGFRDGLNGSQDHDLVLRVLEKTDRVYHIPSILYHWRKIPGSTAAVYDSKSYAWEAGRKAIQDTLYNRNIDATVFLGKFQGSYRVKRRLGDTPLVSIIIPFRDRPDLLEICLTSVLEKTSYPFLELLCVNNDSREPQTRELIKRIGGMDSRIRFIDDPRPFNYSAINNRAVRQAGGEHVVLMNSDIQVIQSDWIESLLEHSLRPEVGAVGAKLLYPNHTIQHAGIVIGIYGNAGHPHKFFPKDDNGYYARPHVIHNVSAVTGALLMVKKSLYLEVGGLDAENLGIAYNDVDFCLKLREKGYLNVFTPYCEAIHHESASRGYEDTDPKKERFETEKRFFQSKWKEVLDAGDPYYNVNLSLESEDFSIRL